MGLASALQFVIECARRSCGASPLPLPSDPDWREVLRHAEAQSLYAAVAAMSDNWPTASRGNDSRRQLKEKATIAQLQRRLRQEPGIQCVLSSLREAGCAPIVLKGAALAYTRYCQPEFRSFADLDVLLSSDELERADRALRASGFEVNAAVPHPPGHQHLAPLFAPQREIVVELHSTLFEAQSPFSIPIDDWIARAEPITLLGHTVRMLSPTDALLHVCAHLSYGHRYLRYPLRSLTDILAITQHDQVNWAELVRRAHESGLSGAVVWPLAAAKAWLQAPIPMDEIRQLFPAQPVRSFIGTAMSSGYILDRSAVADDGTAVAYERLLDLSILGRSSAVTWVRVLTNGLFPAPGAVSHLPPEIAASVPRRMRQFVHPTRVWRGMRAMIRLISQRGDWTRSEALAAASK